MDEKERQRLWEQLAKQERQIARLEEFYLGYCYKCNPDWKEPSKPTECDHKWEANTEFCSKCGIDRTYPYEPDYIVISRKVAEEWLNQPIFACGVDAGLAIEIRKALEEQK